uniref:Amino acid permease n=1 Tax=Panagrellus redivivus TaxID=6233 RepID=A0A7E4W6B4_PANRE
MAFSVTPVSESELGVDQPSTTTAATDNTPKAAVDNAPKVAEDGGLPAASGEPYERDFDVKRLIERNDDLFAFQGGDDNHISPLYDDNLVSFSIFKGYTTPGPLEREESKKKKANLGVMLGVYLPTIQHILGVTMFIRLSWCVGVAGLGQTFLMLLLCCLCTFLTCISVSAVATNGVVESGGAYFMISRNLGPEFGSAVGILFYLANTVATAMYLVGGVEILLLYIFPWLTIGGIEVQTHTGVFGMMSHNYRIYGTILLILEFAIVAMGVKFVQMLAPVSLICVIISILACYAGGVEKTLNPDAGQSICMYDDHLIQSKLIMPDGVGISEICDYCTSAASMLMDELYKRGWNDSSLISCKNGYPGFASDALIKNLGASFPAEGEYVGHKVADRTFEIFQDHTTTFFHLLAIYFPAVTGILTGTNMSGDLKNPQASIPTGTIAAQLTTSFIYFSLALVFGAAISPELLRDKSGLSLNGGMVVAELAWPNKWILLVGSFLSTFGAALQCLCSAPRLLQGIAKDDVIPILAPFSKVTSKNEPFNGLIITTIIAELAILMGGMDNIAAVVDFFFLMCYAFVNLICALHSLLGAPNWRPRYTYYHWSLSLLGAGLCFFIMFSTHWDYALISVFLCMAIYKYVEWKGAKKEWGDGIRGLALTTAQYSLMKIEDEDVHPKNWRPQLLVLHSMPWSKELVDIRYLNLLNLASQLKAGRGLTIVVSFIRGDPTEADAQTNAKTIKKRMEFDMKQVRLRGFAKALLYNEDQITGSLHTLIQSIGIGGLRPNTLLLSWPTRAPDSDEYADSEYQTFTEKLHTGVNNGMCLVVAKGITDFPTNVKLTGEIDVYWIVQDGGLCLLMAFLLKQSKVWRGCKLRIIAVATMTDNNLKLQERLQTYVYELRIDAKIIVCELSDPQISKNAFERTLLMEERTRYMKQLRHPNSLMASLQQQQSRDSSPDIELSSTPGTPATAAENSVDQDGDNGSEKPAHSITNNTDKEKMLQNLDPTKVHKMHTALRLNELILNNSGNSQLVLLNLPKAPKKKEGLEDYIHYLEVLSDNVKRVLFVRGTGAEVITASS